MAITSLAELPRSVRWRIQLGSLIDPTTTDPSVSVTLDSILKWNETAIQQQNQRFQELVDHYLTEEEPEEVEVEVTPTPPEGDEEETNENEIDPLTAMVIEQEAREIKRAELYLKYRKERARRKRGLTTISQTQGEEENDGIDRASLGIIEKDLNRLPHPTESGLGPNAPNLTPKQESRINWLREVLYIYSQVHPTIGYRQGMHEIASYLLFVLELEQPLYPENKLFNPILAICFELLERTLEQLQTAYDVSGGEDSLNQMSNAILNKIHQNDPHLYQLLATNPNIPPPPIYCTRWLRLLFSREVVGYENVFSLWDLFFSLLENNELMHVLEVTSASRILMLRDSLLNPDNNPLDLLMNVPQLSDISKLGDVLNELVVQETLERNSNSPVNHFPADQNNLSPPIPMPMSSSQMHHMSSHGSYGSNLSTDSDKFSFGSLRQQLGQTGKSLRKKIITTTNEWKQQHNDNINKQNSNNANRGQQQYAANPNLFVDPLMYPNPSTPTAITHQQQQQQQPLSPKQHQHQMWSKLLKNKIWTVQDYLMKIESKETGENVPGEVWEALVDLDRMQRELHNYANSMEQGQT